MISESANLEERFEARLNERRASVATPCPGGPGPWTIKECAGVLSVSTQTIRDAIETGELQALCLHPRGQRKHYRVTKAAWEGYLHGAR